MRIVMLCRDAMHCSHVVAAPKFEPMTAKYMV